MVRLRIITAARTASSAPETHDAFPRRREEEVPMEGTRELVLTTGPALPPDPAPRQRNECRAAEPTLQIRKSVSDSRTAKREVLRSVSRPETSRAFH